VEVIDCGDYSHRYINPEANPPNAAQQIIVRRQGPYGEQKVDVRREGEQESNDEGNRSDSSGRRWFSTVRARRKHNDGDSKPDAKIEKTEHCYRKLHGARHPRLA
jgi:hypothetical protein